MEGKFLKPYKGFNIEKTWESNLDGTIRKSTVIYTAYDENDGIYDADKTISGIKKKIDIYVG